MGMVDNKSISYIIYMDGITVKAVNGTTGVVDYSGTDAAIVINNAINSLTSGRTWKEKVVVKGYYTITDTITVNSYTILDLYQAKLTLANDVNKDMINTPDLPQQFAIMGGILDGNYTNQSGTSNGIKLSSISAGPDIVGDNLGILQDTWVVYCKDSGIYISGNILELRLYNVNSYLNRGRGFLMGGADHKIVSCGAGGNQLSGFECGGTETEFVNCKAFSNDKIGASNYYGFMITADGQLFTNCQAEDNQHTGANIYQAQHITMVGCQFNNNGWSGLANSAGLKIQTSQNINIIGCNLYCDNNATKNQKYGTHLQGTTDKVRIISCMFKDNTVGPVLNEASGTDIVFKNNIGYKTDSNVLSETFVIYSTGIKTVTVVHGLDIIPRVQDCYLTVVQNTAVDDWAYNLLKVISADSKNVIVKINISTASVTVGATAKLALRVGNP